jgi:hypothetical protein
LLTETILPETELLQEVGTASSSVPEEASATSTTVE